MARPGVLCCSTKGDRKNECFYLCGMTIDKDRWVNLLVVISGGALGVYLTSKVTIKSKKNRMIESNCTFPKALYIPLRI